MGDRGETLTSISKQYGVPMYEIAEANKNLVDVDFVFEGQQLNIPSAAKKFEVVSLILYYWYRQSSYN